MTCAVPSLLQQLHLDVKREEEEAEVAGFALNDLPAENTWNKKATPT